MVDGFAFKAGECMLLEGETVVHAEAECDWLLAYPGMRRR
jgi:mannose-6-phosphate isomerase